MWLLRPRAQGALPLRVFSLLFAGEKVQTAQVPSPPAPEPRVSLPSWIHRGSCICCPWPSQSSPPGGLEKANKSEIMIFFFLEKSNVAAQVWWGLPAEPTREKSALKYSRMFSWSVCGGRWAPIKPLDKLFIMEFG